MNLNNQLIWREVKVVSDSTQAVCEHFRDGTTRCFLRGRNGGKGIDLETFRQTMPSSTQEQKNWFRDQYDENGKHTVTFITENTPDSFFVQDTKLNEHSKEIVPTNQHKKINWWKWFLLLWILAAIARTFSPSGELSKKIREAETNADVLIKQSQ